MRRRRWWTADCSAWWCPVCWMLQPLGARHAQTLTSPPVSDCASRCDSRSRWRASRRWHCAGSTSDQRARAGRRWLGRHEPRDRSGRWLVANRAQYGIRIVNLSLGTTITAPCRFDRMCSSVQRLAQAGMIAVVSAGIRRAADLLGDHIFWGDQVFWGDQIFWGDSLPEGR